MSDFAVPADAYGDFLITIFNQVTSLYEPRESDVHVKARYYFCMPTHLLSGL